MFSGIIDYAGTFPPAALSLSESLKCNLAYKKKATHPWLWSKVALNLSDLKNINSQTLFECGYDGHPLIATILGTPFTGKTASDLIKHIEWDLREIEHCKKRAFHSSARQIFVSYEMKLPPMLEISGLMAPILNRFSELSELEPFFEVEWGDSFEKNFLTLLHDLSAWKEDNDETELTPGVKVRTGGKYVPTSLELAKTVLSTTHHRLRFKATQGLHHAVTNASGFGFANLFIALNLSQAYGEMEFGLEAIKSCLEEKNGKAFQFFENLFKYKTFELNNEDIEKSRRVHSATFGSCSLDEPDQFLSEEL